MTTMLPPPISPCFSALCGICARCVLRASKTDAPPAPSNTDAPPAPSNTETRSTKATIAPPRRKGKRV